MIRPKTYDELVALSPQGSLFANRWWLEALAADRLNILELRNRADELIAAWPLVERKSDGKVHYVMPPLSQKLGILFAPSSQKTAKVQSTHQGIVSGLIGRLGATATFHQNFHETFTDWLPFFWTGFSQTTRYTYILEDLSNLDRLWTGLRKDHRYIIRRAQKLGLKVNDYMGLDDFIELNRKTFSRQGRTPLADDDTIRRMDAACQNHAGRKIFAAEDAEGRIHAAVYIAWWNGTAYYLMGGSETELRTSGAQYLAIWEAIRFAATVARRFDFEGSMLPQIERVFRGFGATQVPYFSISKEPPRPSNLREYFKASIEFRLNRVMRRFTSAA